MRKILNLDIVTLKRFAAMVPIHVTNTDSILVAESAEIPYGAQADESLDSVVETRHKPIYLTYNKYVAFGKAALDDSLESIFVADQVKSRIALVPHWRTSKAGIISTLYCKLISILERGVDDDLVVVRIAPRTYAIMSPKWFTLFLNEKGIKSAYRRSVYMLSIRSKLHMIKDVLVPVIKVDRDNCLKKDF